MDPNVPYMATVRKIPEMMAKIQNAALPSSFTLDFLKDLGFTSSNDRGIIKILKYIGFIDNNSRPLDPYRNYLDHTIGKKVLAKQLRVAFDDLFAANKNAEKTPTSDLKGWFKTKTGSSDAVAEKIASTFKAFASQADFSENADDEIQEKKPKIEIIEPDNTIKPEESDQKKLNLVYRFEIHLPDTPNINTYRAIFKALKEELL